MPASHTPVTVLPGLPQTFLKLWARKPAKGWGQQRQVMAVGKLCMLQQRSTSPYRGMGDCSGLWILMSCSGQDSLWPLQEWNNSPDAGSSSATGQGTDDKPPTTLKESHKKLMDIYRLYRFKSKWLRQLFLITISVINREWLILSAVCFELLLLKYVPSQKPTLNNWYKCIFIFACLESKQNLKEFICGVVVYKHLFRSFIFNLFNFEMSEKQPSFVRWYFFLTYYLDGNWMD